ncbi:hypothetical protein EDF56_11614 [Novosphingobium sp. PhB165]|uniref:hypothetical protein n=1 Tax=Novosphingobium sp. PhB165 TaxID=2485105 RepID=UPI00104A03DC|nr:hypothetical protein [Novosphingobium sp. PhB165]TCM12990.1 hypothetical protein EDF56_11614 [Novosphingobium sp. PhB165]
MDEDAVFAFGSALAAIGGLLEEKGLCTAKELAQSLRHAAMVHLKAEKKYHVRGEYLCAWAVSVKAAADGASAAPRH